MCAQMAVWHRITIASPELSLGKPLADFLDDLFKHIPTKVAFALLYEAEGSGDPIRGITQLGCKAIRLSELTDRLRHTVQLDWATLCFVRNIDEQEILSICSEQSMAKAIAESVFAVRVIDDSYLDIFTWNDQFKSYLIEEYQTAQVESCYLDRMIFPK